MQAALETSQAQMRHAHFDGAPGVLVSGVVWIMAAAACHYRGTASGMWVLLMGGACIHPLASVLTRVLGRPGKATANPLNALAAASTVWLIACCAMAYGLYRWIPMLFFPAMLLSIGSRYMTFTTLFGRSLYWILGAVLVVAACLAVFFKLSPMSAALLGGVPELVFAGVVFSSAGRSSA